MPYPADLLGKAIKLEFTRKTIARTPGSPVLGQWSHDLSVPVFNFIPGRPGAGGAPPIPGRLVNTNTPWNITFLEYVPGDTTTTRLSRPVLTGPMSGCYLFKYVSGGPRISHVGTDDGGPNSTGSLNAKNNWKTYVTQQNATGVVGATPADFYSPGERVGAQVGKMGGIPQVYGFFNTDGTSHAMLLAPIGTDSITGAQKLFLVKAIKTMHLQPWSAIQALRTFR